MVAMLLASALAGCVGNLAPTQPPVADDGVVPPSADASGLEVPWGFETCTWVVAAIPTEASRLEHHFPEGFTPMTPEEMGLPPQPHANAVMGLEAFDCERGPGLNGSVEPMIYSAYWSPTHPPANVSRDGAKLQFVKWETLIPDEDRRERLQAAGVPAVDGSVDLSGFRTTPAGYAFEVSFRIGEDAHAFTGIANSPGDESMKNFTAREFTATPNGIVLWDTRVVSPHMMQGTGTVHLEPGTFPAEIVGQTEAQAFFLAGTAASFLEGTLHLPGPSGDAS